MKQNDGRRWGMVVGGLGMKMGNFCGGLVDLICGTHVPEEIKREED